MGLRAPLGFALLGLLTSTIACGDATPPAASASSAPAATTAAPAETATTEPAPEARKRKPYEIYSHCSEVVTVAFGADAKAANAGKRTIAPSSAIDGPRDNDGNQTVWLLDAAGEPLAKVSVTRGMKRVEIGKSCRTLDAR